MSRVIENPETGHLIEEWGPTFRKLIRDTSQWAYAPSLRRFVDISGLERHRKGLSEGEDVTSLDACFKVVGDARYPDTWVRVPCESIRAMRTRQGKNVVVYGDPGAVRPRELQRLPSSSERVNIAAIGPQVISEVNQSMRHNNVHTLRARIIEATREAAEETKAAVQEAIGARLDAQRGEQEQFRVEQGQKLDETQAAIAAQQETLARQQEALAAQQRQLYEQMQGELETKLQALQAHFDEKCRQEAIIADAAAAQAGKEKEKEAAAANAAQEPEARVPEPQVSPEPQVNAEAQEALEQLEIEAQRKRMEAERIEAERVAEQQRAEAERIEAERVAEQQRAEAERIEAERVAEQRAEAERIEAERVAEQQRAEAERIEAERVAEQQRAEVAGQIAAQEDAVRGRADTLNARLAERAEEPVYEYPEYPQGSMWNSIRAAIGNRNAIRRAATLLSDGTSHSVAYTNAKKNALQQLSRQYNNATTNDQRADIAKQIVNVLKQNEPSLANANIQELSLREHLQRPQPRFGGNYGVRGRAWRFNPNTGIREAVYETPAPPPPGWEGRARAGQVQTTNMAVVNIESNTAPTAEMMALTAEFNSLFAKFQNVARKVPLEERGAEESPDDLQSAEGAVWTFLDTVSTHRDSEIQRLHPAWHSKVTQWTSEWERGEPNTVLGEPIWSDLSSLNSST